MPSFSSPPRGIWQLKCPNPQEFGIQGKKKKTLVMPGGEGGTGRSWVKLMQHKSVTANLFLKSDTERLI